MERGLSVVFLVFESSLAGASYLISLGGEVTHALVIVFTAHITQCRESCSSGGLTYRVLVSREEILFSQEWVERHLVGGILMGQ